MQKHALRKSWLISAAIAMLGLSACTTTSAPPQTKQVLESEATSALNRLHSAIPGTRDQVARAQAVLICPRVVGGSFVVGVEHGRCVLRSKGVTKDYYSTTGASVGWQAGGQSRAVIYVFSGKDAYDKFLSSNGWSVGVDATVAVGKAGANGSVDSITADSPVSSYVLNNSGLEVGASVEGAKITKIKL